MSIPAFPRPRPPRKVLDGRYTRLEPIGPQHAADLFRACAGPDNVSRFEWLFETPPKDEAEIAAWIEKVRVPEDPLVFAVSDRASAIASRQSPCAGYHKGLLQFIPAVHHERSVLGHVFADRTAL